MPSKECEETVWTIWGLVSSWNPDWRFNQDHMFSMAIEDNSCDITTLLVIILHRNDESIKSKALGTLVQLMYHHNDFKKKLSKDARLLNLSIHLLRHDIFMSLTRQDITLWTMRLLATMCSTPISNAESCEAVAAHPGLLEAVLDLPRLNNSAISAEVTAPPNQHHPSPGTLLRDDRLNDCPNLRICPDTPALLPISP